MDEEETREETLARGTAAWRKRVESGQRDHGLGPDQVLSHNVQHLVSPIVGHLRLLERDQEVLPVDALDYYIDRLVLVLELAREEEEEEREAESDPVGATSDVAQELLEAAGRMSRLEERSLLLAASRLADQVIMENLRLTRRVQGLTEVVDASLAVEMALMDSREAVARVEALAGELEDGVFPQTRADGAAIRKALAPPEEEESGGGGGG